MEPGWTGVDLEDVLEAQGAGARAFAAEATALARLFRSASSKEQGWGGRAPWAGLVMELAGSLSVSQRTAETRLADATHLVERLPGTHAALERGELFVSQARVVMNETATSTLDVCTHVEQQVLATAARYTPAQLRDRVRRLVISADPVQAQEDHDREKDGRATWVKPAPNGMAFLGTYVTGVQAKRYEGDLAALLGRTVVAEGDARTDEQRRADLVADLPGFVLELLDRAAGVLPPLGVASVVDRYVPGTPQPAGNRAARRRRRKTQVLVQVPVDTALLLSKEPVWLDGYGWITAEQGVALLPESELRQACVDPRSGRLVGLGAAFVPGGGQPATAPFATTDAGDFGGDAEALVRAFHAAQDACFKAKAALQDALEAEGLDHRDAGLLADDLTGLVRPAMLDDDVAPEAAHDRRTTARPAPPEALDVAEAVHRALHRMAAEPMVLTDDDPALRTEPGHDPSEALREFVDLRDGGCDGPGCHTSPTVNDLDHEVPYPVGATTASGLRNRSRRCHGGKHHGWSVEVDSLGWSTWTSPGGRSYRRPPRHEPPPPPPSDDRRPQGVSPRLRIAPGDDDRPAATAA